MIQITKHDANVVKYILNSQRLPVMSKEFARGLNNKRTKINCIINMVLQKPNN